MPFYIDATCKRNLANASANASLNRICERAYSPYRNDFTMNKTLGRLKHTFLYIGETSEAAAGHWTVLCGVVRPEGQYSHNKTHNKTQVENGNKEL